ncbi:hypothetical protein BaRGS_00027005 [Batillaria attramentaria]|uniref:Retrotransposon gag domain-containing protein n=1 Tax=Batillaria attramentaria TaxID=370345 RepID=A0ABD0K4K1_9CAEN
MTDSDNDTHSLTHTDPDHNREPQAEFARTGKGSPSLMEGNREARITEPQGFQSDRDTLKSGGEDQREREGASQEGLSEALGGGTSEFDLDLPLNPLNLREIQREDKLSAEVMAQFNVTPAKARPIARAMMSKTFTIPKFLTSPLPITVKAATLEHVLEYRGYIPGSVTERGSHVSVSGCRLSSALEDFGHNTELLVQLLGQINDSVGRLSSAQLQNFNVLVEQERRVTNSIAEALTETIRKLQQAAQDLPAPLLAGLGGLREGLKSDIRTELGAIKEELRGTKDQLMSLTDQVGMAADAAAAQRQTLVQAVSDGLEAVQAAQINRFEGLRTQLSDIALKVESVGHGLASQQDQFETYTRGQTEFAEHLRVLTQAVLEGALSNKNGDSLRREPDDFHQPGPRRDLLLQHEGTRNASGTQRELAEPIRSQDPYEERRIHWEAVLNSLREELPRARSSPQPRHDVCVTPSQYANLQQSPYTPGRGQTYGNREGNGTGRRGRDDVPKLRNYDGSTPWRVFEEQFEEYRLLKDWDPLLAPRPSAYSFGHMQQESQETLREFAARLREVAPQALPDVPNRFLEDNCISQLFVGCRNKEAAFHCANGKYPSLNAAVQALQVFADNRRAILGTRRSQIKVASLTSGSDSSDEETYRVARARVRGDRGRRGQDAKALEPDTRKVTPSGPPARSGPSPPQSTPASASASTEDRVVETLSRLEANLSALIKKNLAQLERDSAGDREVTPRRTRSSPGRYRSPSPKDRASGACFICHQHKVTLQGSAHRSSRGVRLTPRPRSLSAGARI